MPYDSGLPPLQESAIASPTESGVRVAVVGAGAIGRQLHLALSPDERGELRRSAPQLKAMQDSLYSRVANGA
jgi:hypothetical protein